jgi:hypothetical protein
MFFIVFSLQEGLLVASFLNIGVAGTGAEPKPGEALISLQSFLPFLAKRFGWTQYPTGVQGPGRDRPGRRRRAPGGAASQGAGGADGAALQQGAGFSATCRVDGEPFLPWHWAAASSCKRLVNSTLWKLPGAASIYEKTAPSIGYLTKKNNLACLAIWFAGRARMQINCFAF